MHCLRKAEKAPASSPEANGMDMNTGMYAGSFFEDSFGAYAQMSIGPGRSLGGFLVQDDPTNGTTSAGNIRVSQKTRARRHIPLEQAIGS